MTHIIFSPEFETGGAGLTQGDAHCKLIATVNGLYQNFLLEGHFASYRPKIDGLSYLKEHLTSIGWDFEKVGTQIQSFKMPSLDEFLKRQPLFKIEVLEKVEVSEMDIEIEFPAFD